VATVAQFSSISIDELWSWTAGEKWK